MGYFNVVRPCVVGKLHYATVPAQPVEVPDDVAAPLVASGDLAPYRPGGVARVEAANRAAVLSAENAAVAAEKVAQEEEKLAELRADEPVQPPRDWVDAPAAKQPRRSRRKAAES